MKGLTDKFVIMPDVPIESIDKKVALKTNYCLLCAVFLQLVCLLLLIVIGAICYYHINNTVRDKQQ